MNKSAFNDIQKVKIIITNDLFHDSEPNKTFKWFRASSGNYTFEKIKYRYKYEVNKLSDFAKWIYYYCDFPEPDTDITIIKQKNIGVDFYTPDFHEISQALMNVFVNDDSEILEFYRKYGPLGVMPYLTNQLSPNFIDIIHADIKICSEKNSYWPSLFGLDDIFPFDPIETEKSGHFVNTFNLLEDKSLYRTYYEPLYAVKYLITEYQLNCRLLCSKNAYKNYSESRLGISETNSFNEFYNDFYAMIKDETKIVPNFNRMKNFRLFAYCNSLLHAAYQYTVLNIQRYPLEKCIAPDCTNLFWKTNNRRQYCSKTCKTRIGVRNHYRKKSSGKKEKI